MNNKKGKLKNFSAGFTLMEILVVMVIIGILVSIGISSLISSQKKGRDANRKEDLHQLTTALELYYNDKGKYPEGDSGVIRACGSGGGNLCNWGEEFYDDNGTYMVQLPADPTNGYHYYYRTDLARSYYEVFAYLENDQDKDLQKNGADQVMTFDGTDCGGRECNYGISSTNKELSDPQDP